MDAKGDDAYRPKSRNRKVSAALQAYASLTSSAARGAVRMLRPAFDGAARLAQLERENAELKKQLSEVGVAEK
jgi:hypothetical protein